MVNSRAKIWCVKLWLDFMACYCFIFMLNFTFHFIQSHKIPLQFVTAWLHYFEQPCIMCDLCPSLLMAFLCYLWAFWTEQTSVQTTEISISNSTERTDHFFCSFQPISGQGLSPFPWLLRFPRSLWGNNWITFTNMLLISSASRDRKGRISRHHAIFFQVDHIYHI